MEAQKKIDSLQKKIAVLHLSIQRDKIFRRQYHECEIFLLENNRVTKEELMQFFKKLPTIPMPKRKQKIETTKSLKRRNLKFLIIQYHLDKKISDEEYEYYVDNGSKFLSQMLLNKRITEKEIDEWFHKE